MKTLWALVFLSLAGAVVLGQGSDFFTPEEVQKLRDFQEIDKRAENFLKIAAARLDELDRRLELSKGASPDPNPLEFFRLSELVMSYNAAYDSLMNNLDDRFKSKGEPKRLKKAFKMTLDKTREFFPRVEKIRELSIEKQDKALYDQTLLALENSGAALKGSENFLAVFDSGEEKPKGKLKEKKKP